MSRFARWVLVPALMFGWLIAVGPAAAVSPEIKDGGKFFSAEAIKEANAIIKEIEKKHKKDVLIDTYAKLPANLMEQYEKEKRDAFFANWARKRANAVDVQGIVILITKEPAPTRIQVGVGDATAKKAFTKENRGTLTKKLMARFDEG